jgi:hypothetical protein
MTREFSKSKMTDQAALSYGFGNTTLDKIFVATLIKGSYPSLSTAATRNFYPSFGADVTVRKGRRLNLDQQSCR